MKNAIGFFLSILILVNLTGCSIAHQEETLEGNNPQHTESGGEETELSTSVVNTTPYGTCAIRYPEIAGPNAISEEINLLVRQELNTQLTEICGEDTSETFIKLDHSVTLRDEEYLCILFEGYVDAKFAAHPTNLAVPVCILLKSGVAVDPLTLFELNDAFISAFRDALKSQDSEYRNDPKWEKIVSYIGGLSDEEIINIIQSNPKQTIVSQPDGMIVIFPVSHTLGDYAKIYVLLD